MSTIRVVGLDVHADTMAWRWPTQTGDVRSLGPIANRAELIRTLVKKLGPADRLRVCYEGRWCKTRR